MIIKMELLNFLNLELRINEFEVLEEIMELLNFYFPEKIKSMNRVKFPIKFTTMNCQKEQLSKPVLIPVPFYGKKSVSQHLQFISNLTAEFH